MKYLLLVLIIIICFYETGFTQPVSKAFSVDFSLSPEAGRWIYNRGQNENGEFRGFDRSFLSFLYAAELGVYYHRKSFKAGIQATYRVLAEDDLVRSQHSRFNFGRYLISETGLINLPTISLVLGYDLVHYPTFHLIPQVSFGTFFLETVHPEKENFGFNFVWSAGFINEWKKGKISLFLHPHYTSYIIFPKENLHPGELNQIYSLGVKLGVRVWVFRGG